MTDAGDTVRITLPPNKLFHAGEQYYVKESHTNGVTVRRMGIDILLSLLSYDNVEKDWRRIKCPACETVMLEIDRLIFNAHSVRVQCRSCKEFTIVRGIRPVLYNEAQLVAIKTEMKRKVLSGEYRGVEAAVTLFAMAKAGRITEESIEDIIKFIYVGNELEAIQVLGRARQIINGELIDEIMEAVKEDLEE